MMEVAVISPNPASSGGGVERFCNVLRDCLVDGGHNASVLGPKDGPSNAQVVITNGMTGWVHDKSSVRVHVYHGTWPAHVIRGGLDGSSRRFIAKRFIEGWHAEFRAGVSAHRVAVSSSTQREIKRWYGMSSIVLENAVDTTIFRPGDRDSARRRLGLSVEGQVALFVGRPESRKGGELAKRIAEAVGLQLVHAGTPQLSGSTWLGALAPIDLVNALNAADVVLLPSFYEGCSLAVLEAFASGVPVVTTRTGWVSELELAIPSFRRYVADPGDLAGLILATRHAISDNREIQNAAHSLVVNENSLKAFGSRWICFLESIAGSDPAPNSASHDQSDHQRTSASGNPLQFTRLCARGYRAGRR